MQTFMYMCFLLCGESEAFTYPCEPLTRPLKAGFMFLGVAHSMSISPIYQGAEAFIYVSPLGLGILEMPKFLRILNLWILWKCCPHPVVKGQASILLTTTIFTSLPGRPHWRIPRIPQIKVSAVKGSHSS